MAVIQNRVIVSGGVAQDVLPAYHGWGGFIITGLYFQFLA